MLKKGDPCYVRLYSGEIVKAEYDEYGGCKNSFILLGNKELLAVDKIEREHECRFVCMTGLNKGKENESA